MARAWRLFVALQEGLSEGHETAGLILAFMFWGARAPQTPPVARIARG